MLPCLGQMAGFEVPCFGFPIQVTNGLLQSQINETKRGVRLWPQMNEREGLVPTSVQGNLSPLQRTLHMEGLPVVFTEVSTSHNPNEEAMRCSGAGLSIFLCTH